MGVLRRSTRLWCALAALPVLVGCSTTTAPAATVAATVPSGSPTAEVSAAPTGAAPPAVPAPPTAPPADPSEQGAVDAAVYFTELYGYVAASRDLTEWRAMSDPECVFCASVMDTMLQDGTTTEGAQLVVESAELVGVNQDGLALVHLEIEQQPWRTLDGEGREVDTGESNVGSVDTVLHVVDGRWIVLEYTPKDGGA
ncbi:DUF6318 family protein [Cellulomonas marina]|uniref:DUF6318 domain-containing protein n=1 Tax=Cellulomonas marina TaxID=988821 RepID=A0A1I0ZD65_9CELL|nr:DUF6318 family protein [Cellulomonas marina]GIG29017.1 hypothetical protein Cma02nite_16170 [Cellulomonas marina]SFB22153.1 hypothetical protein SAMN05421867_11056 [Cellulomonas marina]